MMQSIAEARLVHFVDDEVSVRAVLARWLRSRGHAVADFETAESFLVWAIDTALRHSAVDDAAQARKVEIEARLAGLTPREREVLDHVMNGRLNKQIAYDIGTSEKTVKVHRARAMQKMQVRSVAELVRLVERAR
jgi:FixJ family two-component response regulator